MEIANATLTLEDQMIDERKERRVATEDAFKAQNRVGDLEKLLWAAGKKASKVEHDLMKALKGLSDLQSTHQSCTSMLNSKETKIEKLNQQIAHLGEEKKQMAEAREQELAEVRYAAIETFKKSDAIREFYAPTLFEYFEYGVDHILRLLATSG